MSRRGVYRGIFSAMLDDPDYQRLTPDARLVLLTLRLCAQAGAAAIFRFYTPVLAEQTGLVSDDVEKALVELASSPSTEEPWVFREGPVAWVRNGLRYDPNLRLADPKHRKSVERAVQDLPRLAIVARFCEYYELASPFDDSTEGLGRASEDLSSPNTEYRVPNTETEAEVRGAPQPLGGSHSSRESFSRKRVKEAWGV
jgi:hypothetical protein